MFLFKTRDVFARNTGCLCRLRRFFICRSFAFRPVLSNFALCFAPPALCFEFFAFEFSKVAVF